MAKKMPTWVSEVFDRFINQVNRITSLSLIIEAGIANLSNIDDYRARRPRLLQNRLDEAAILSSMESFDRTMNITRKELSEGLPTFYAEQIVYLCACLEDYVNTALVCWIATNRNLVMEIDEVKKIKIPFTEYEKLSYERKTRYILKAVEEQIKNRSHYGVDRFEALFKVFNLSCPLDQQVRQSLIELFQVRNIVIHRGGVVDDTFIKVCEWLNIKEGTRFPVEGQTVVRYNNAATSYAVNVVSRFGVDTD